MKRTRESAGKDILNEEQARLAAQGLNDDQLELQAFSEDGKTLNCFSNWARVYAKRVAQCLVSRDAEVVMTCSTAIEPARCSQMPVAQPLITNRWTGKGVLGAAPKAPEGMPQASC